MRLSLGEHKLLIDPMLSDPGAIPGFKMLGGGRRRNPLVPLPENARPWLEEVTAVVLTHEHPDHFDRAAVEWTKQRGLPVWANSMDAPSLRRKGLDVHVLEDGALNLTVEIVPSRHGRGPVGWLMGPVAGYYLAHPAEPSLYITGDSVLTDSVLDAVERLNPDVLLVPAGAANMGIGGDILFSVDELVTLANRAKGEVVMNHLEALDHCPTTRTGLRARMDVEGLGARVHIPADGEAICFQSSGSTHGSRPRVVELRPGVQKWVAVKLTGT